MLLWNTPTLSTDTLGSIVTRSFHMSSRRRTARDEESERRRTLASVMAGIASTIAIDVADGKKRMSLDWYRSSVRELFQFSDSMMPCPLDRKRGVLGKGVTLQEDC